jgi:hypothetical protein
MFRKSTILATVLVVMGLLSVFAPSAFAKPAVSTAGGWTVLGGDPLVPGGVNNHSDFVRTVTSQKGQTAMTFAGLNKVERQAVTKVVRKGAFAPCTMRYGQKFWRMSFGINGTSVDRNVTFHDNRYLGGAPSWCATAMVGGKGGYTVTIMMPYKCGNVAVPYAPSRKLPKPKRLPKHVAPKHPAAKPKVAPKPASKPQLPTVGCKQGFQVGNVGGLLACVPQVISQQATQTATQSSDTTQKQGATTSGNGSPATQVNVSVSPQITVQASSQSATQSASNANAGQTQSTATTPCTCTTTPTTTTCTCTTTTTTTPPPPAPKSDVDLCLNIVGTQTAIPAGFRKDPTDPGVPGNCYYNGP